MVIIKLISRSFVIISSTIRATDLIFHLPFIYHFFLHLFHFVLFDSLVPVIDFKFNFLVENSESASFYFPFFSFEAVLSEIRSVTMFLYRCNYWLIHSSIADFTFGAI